MKQKSGKVLLALLTVLSLSFRAEAQYTGKVLAESVYQWTGIAVTKEKRIFVNFPAWDIPSPYKVAELVDGKLTAYPSEEDNRMFVCVQSVVVDDLGRLWILDPANAQFKGVAESGAKLHMVNLQTNKIERTYSFAKDVAPEASYLNDVRIDTDREFAYITDSELGGVVVTDLRSGESWRALDSTVEAVRANLKGIYFPATGEWPNRVHSDGIELSGDGEMLYFTALTGDILYKVPTSVLRDRSATIEKRSGQIEVENKNNLPTDGMLLKDDKLFMGDLRNESIWAYDLRTKTGANIDLGFPVRWADSFASDAEGTIYFTTAQINYPVGQRVKYQIIEMKEKK